jgi:hypothetical protein
MSYLLATKAVDLLVVGTLKFREKAEIPRVEEPLEEDCLPASMFSWSQGQYGRRPLPQRLLGLGVGFQRASARGYGSGYCW